MARPIQRIDVINFYQGLNLIDAATSLTPFQLLNAKNHTFGDGNILETRQGYTQSQALYSYSDTNTAYFNPASTGLNYNEFTTPSNAYTANAAYAVCGYVNNNTGWNNPSATGETYDDWTNPSYAYESNGNYAESETLEDAQDYYNFNLTVPSGATILGIVVSIQARFGEEPGSSGYLDVKLSRDGGSNYTEDVKQNSYDYYPEYKEYGDSTDLWGLSSWNYSHFSNSNFRVYIENDAANSEDLFRIDHIRVKVYYKIANEQQDYYSFSISLSASATAILGIQVDVKGKNNEAGSNATLNAYLSKNGGSSWSDSDSVTFTDSNAYQTLGGSTDLWDSESGYTWGLSDFGDADFVVRLQGTNYPIDIDHVRVKVYYRASSGTTSTAIDGLFRYDDDTNFFNAIVCSGEFVTDNGTEQSQNLTYHTTAATATTGGDPAFTSGLRPDFHIYDDILYHSNGTDYQHAYRNTAWNSGVYLRRTGLAIPTTGGIATGMTASGATAGISADLPQGVYKLRFSLELNDGVIVEGNACTAESWMTIEIDEAYGKIGVTVTATGVDAEGCADWLNVYATDTGGSVYYYLTGMSLTAAATASFELTAYTDIDKSTGNELQTDNYRPPIGTRNIFWNSHHWIFGCGNTYGYASKYGRYESFPGNVSKSRSAGDPVSCSYVLDFEDTPVGAEIAANGGLFVLCQNSLHLITGYSASTFSKTTLTRSIGCVSKSSIAKGIDGKIYWLGHDDIYMYDGSSVERIGKYVWPLFDEFGKDDKDNICGFFINHRYYLAYSYGGGSYANRLVEFDTRYNYDSNGDSKVDIFGAWLGVHEGINVRCFAKTRKEGETEAWFGAGDESVVYKFNEGDTDNGENIETECKTGIWYPSGYNVTNRFISFSCEVRRTGTSPQANLLIDGGQTNEICPLLLDKGTLLWDDEDNEDPEYGHTWNEAGLKWQSESDYTPTPARLSQRATGNNLQIIISNKTQVDTDGNDVQMPDRNFAIRNLNVLYSPIRRWRG